MFCRYIRQLVALATMVGCGRIGFDAIAPADADAGGGIRIRPARLPAIHCLGGHEMGGLAIDQIVTFTP